MSESSIVTICPPCKKWPNLGTLLRIGPLRIGQICPHPLKESSEPPVVIFKWSLTRYVGYTNLSYQTMCTLSIANSILLNWSIVKLLILFYFILFSKVFCIIVCDYNLYALLVLLVTMLVATITTPHNLTI